MRRIESLRAEIVTLTSDAHMAEIAAEQTGIEQETAAQRSATRPRAADDEQVAEIRRRVAEAEAQVESLAEAQQRRATLLASGFNSSGCSWRMR